MSHMSRSNAINGESSLAGIECSDAKSCKPPADRRVSLSGILMAGRLPPPPSPAVHHHLVHRIPSKVAATQQGPCPGPHGAARRCRKIVAARPNGRALIGALERAIGWDGYRLFGVDPRTLLINRLLSASDNDHRARREWLEEVYLDDRTLPYLQLPAIIRARLRGVAFQPTQEQSWGYPSAMLSGIEPEHHRSYYYESESPIGGTLHGAFDANGRQIAVLQAYRRDPNAHFRPKDVALIQTGAPIVGQALGTALDRERAWLNGTRAPQAASC